jgi:hypothetical protein
VVPLTPLSGRLPQGFALQFRQKQRVGSGISPLPRPLYCPCREQHALTMTSHCCLSTLADLTDLQKPNEPPLFMEATSSTHHTIAKEIFYSTLILPSAFLAISIYSYPVTGLVLAYSLLVICLFGCKLSLVLQSHSSSLITLSSPIICSSPSWPR